MEEQTTLAPRGVCNFLSLSPWPSQGYDPTYIDEEMGLGLDEVVESASARAFLEVITGSPVSKDLDRREEAYLSYIKFKVNRLPGTEIRHLLAGSAREQPVPLDQIFRLLASIAECANSASQFGVDPAIFRLVQDGIFSKQTMNEGTDLNQKARVVVYTAISWICMLYSAPDLGRPYKLRMDETQMINAKTATQSLEEARRSICETIQHFGSLMPAKAVLTEQVQSSQLLAGVLLVSQLNVNALVRIGHIKVKWINNISAHLEFDLENGQLCKVIERVTLLSMDTDLLRSSIMDNYYDDYSKPVGFTMEKYLQEIRMSYRLLFGDDKQSRQYFKTIMKSCVEVTGLIDPFLTELCLSATSPTPATSYSIVDAFPILGPRLSRLQRHMQSQESSGSLALLWQDRRDMLRWYTFWLVSIVGGLGILLAIAQTIIGAAQVYYQSHSATTS